MSEGAESRLRSARATRRSQSCPELANAFGTPQPIRHAECDIIMKGGITSGIVYPSAIATLATHYRLRSIGGTSAGAIAAAAAAAAEYGRASGAFDRTLATLPDELGRDGDDARTRRAFSACSSRRPSTQSLFDLLVAGLMPDARHGWLAAARWLFAAIANFPLAALVACRDFLLGA